MRNGRKCVICGELLNGRRYKYCSKKCDKENRKEYNKQYREENKEYFSQYKKNNKEKIKKSNCQYKENHQNEIKAYNKKYQQDNEIQIQKYNKERYKNNKEEILKQTHKYYQNNKDKRKKYDIRNKKRIEEYHKLYQKINKLEIKKQRSEYYEKNKKDISLRVREYKRNNEEKVRESSNKCSRKRRENPIFRLSGNISNGIRSSLRLRNLIKNRNHWEDIVGYTIQDLKRHLEALFTEGMTWDNHGRWHIDHIIPVSFFKFKKIGDVEFKMCWRLKNLQPLWAVENLRKSNKIL